MRNIMNISLPRTLAKKVEDAVRKEHFASKSEFSLSLARMDGWSSCPRI